MMSNNKILTVSYGTFSCTLEGFEDSFGTMKAIAEYFRDLAQDDRYFGAEPPQPDAEMLARIAEREIERRVQGHSHEGTVVLKATAPAELPQTARTQAPPQPPAPRQTEVPSAAALDTAAPTARNTDALIAGAVAGAVVLAKPAEAAVDATDIAAHSQMNVEHAEPTRPNVLPLDAEIRDEANVDLDSSGTQSTVPKDMAVTSQASAAAPEPDNDVIDDIPAVMAAVADDIDTTQAARLHSAEDAEDVAEDPLAAIAAELDADLMASVPAQDEVPEATSLPRDAAGNDAQASMHGEDVFEFVADELDAAHAPADDEDHDLEDAPEFVAQMAIEDATVPSAATAGKVGSIAAKLQRIRDVVASNQAEENAAYSEDEHADDAQVAPIDEAEAEVLAARDVAVSGNTNDADTTPTEILPRKRPRARVIKVKKADLDAAIARGALEEMSAEPDAATETETETETLKAPEPKAPSSLSTEDEADLLRELAQVEAEIEGAVAADCEAQSAPVPDPSEDAVDLAHIAAVVNSQSEPQGDTSRAEKKASKRKKAAQAAVEDSALDRLMAQADTHMEEPEGSSRRAAFDHLRAAVVATRDDDALSAQATGDSDDDAYRTDLAKAVKPRRPQSGHKGRDANAHRASSRPAPLKLVAELRVDTHSARTGPVRPRRVAAEDPAPLPEDAQRVGSFIDYATERGAQVLPDLLEAAAAFLIFVEGRDQFTRPQLMTKVRQVGSKDFTREDGLRSFGQLLRAGKIEKIKGGRFTVSEEIGFRPDGQRAAG